MIRVVSFLLIMTTLLFSATLFEAGGIPETILQTDNEKLSPARESQNIGNYINQIEASGYISPSQKVLLGITYEYGMEDSGIKKDLGKAKKYYKEASQNGVAYGAIKLAGVLFDEGSFAEAEGELLDAFQYEKTLEEEILFNEMMVLLAAAAEDYASLYYFSKESAKVDETGAYALNVFFLKHNGAADEVSIDLVEAEKYINIACNVPKPAKKVMDFCLNSRLLDKKD